MVTKPKIALNDDKNSPYTISYYVQLADESVFRAFKVSPSTALSFAKRHCIEIPPLTDDFEGNVEECYDN